MQRYRFHGRVCVEPLMLERLRQERESDGRLDFGYCNDPFRSMQDDMLLEIEVLSPNVMNEAQTKAFEDAMNGMIRDFRWRVMKAFDEIKRETPP